MQSKRGQIQYYLEVVSKLDHLAEYQDDASRRQAHQHANQVQYMRYASLALQVLYALHIFEPNFVDVRQE